MSRLPRAAKRLIEQVAQVRPEATSEASDIDGLDVYRTLTFDRATGKWLKPFVEHDERISSAKLGSRGGLVLEFVTTTKADQAGDFPLPPEVDDAIERAAAEADEDEKSAADGGDGLDPEDS